jgi:branched-chain amino acid transport system ATP-binding protein
VATSVEPVLTATGLGVRFGGHKAVDGVTCSFMQGTLTAIVGPNGAGKTTFFNLLSGHTAATEGDVFLFGEKITDWPASRRARRGLGRGFQLTNLFPNLSAHENVRLAVQSRKGAKWPLASLWSRHSNLIDEADSILARTGLEAHRDTPARALSHGDQRKLEVAVLTALAPKIYLFDEPTAGMSADEVPLVLDLIARLKAEGGHTILLVEHKMDVIGQLADRVLVLHQGALAADGDVDSVISSDLVQQAYLGRVRAGHN